MKTHVRAERSRSFLRAFRKATSGFAGTLDFALPFARDNALELRELCAGLRGGPAVGRPFVQVDVVVTGTCPLGLGHVVRRVADELVSNALEHGFQPFGADVVRLEVIFSLKAGACITVWDSGPGFAADRIVEGNGFRLLRTMGKLTVVQVDTGTAVRMVLSIPSWRLMSHTPHFWNGIHVDTWRRYVSLYVSFLQGYAKQISVHHEGAAYSAYQKTRTSMNEQWLGSGIRAAGAVGVSGVRACADWSGGAGGVRPDE